mmetsp:Transcript_46512/g.95138  ORF Transcript_46512/g.95138 Transcript_46512/m.95138 type:complete len:147 (+) Transcript_46512:3619-4059(+)
MTKVAALEALNGPLLALALLLVGWAWRKLSVAASSPSPSASGKCPSPPGAGSTTSATTTTTIRTPILRGKTPVVTIFLQMIVFVAPSAMQHVKLSITLPSMNLDCLSAFSNCAHHCELAFARHLLPWSLLDQGCRGIDGLSFRLSQ